MGAREEVFSSAREAVMNRIAGEIILSLTPGEAMRKWRTLFEVNQSRLAKAMNLAPSVLSDYEKNRRKSPGTAFVRKFVVALIRIDEEAGGQHIKEYVVFQKDFGKVIIDLAEFSSTKTVGDVVTALEAKLFTRNESLSFPVYGYTVIDSLEAIKRLDGSEFLQLFGANSLRALVFTGVERGRSPMIAVKIYPIKPRMVVLHGPKSEVEVDSLAIELADRYNMPLALSLKNDVSEVVRALRELVKVERKV